MHETSSQSDENKPVMQSEAVYGFAFYGKKFGLMENKKMVLVQ